MTPSRLIKLNPIILNTVPNQTTVVGRRSVRPGCPISLKPPIPMQSPSSATSPSSMSTSAESLLSLSPITLPPWHASPESRPGQWLSPFSHTHTHTLLAVSGGFRRLQGILYPFFG